MHNLSSKGKRSASLLGLNSGLTHHFILLYILVTKSLPPMFPITSTRLGFMLGMDSLNPSSILTSLRKQNLLNLRNWIQSISRCSGQMLRETMGDEAELGDDSQADDEEVQDLLAEDTQESEDQLDDNSNSQDDDIEEGESHDYKDADDDVPTEQQQLPIFPDPFPIAQADTNFIQTFVANIFIF